MANLETLRDKIDEYVRKYRKDGLPKIIEGDIYALKGDLLVDGIKPSLCWPDTWPQNDRRGIYAIFSEEMLLYVGKASQQQLGYRLGSYFRYGDDEKTCVTAPGHVWKSEPTHIVTWAVPDHLFFEASALEEYLIRELADDLPDNTAGKNA